MTEELLHEILRRLVRIEDGIFGNGAPGLRTRVDRLEQDAARRKWQLRTILAALITGGVAFGHRYIFRLL